jgi:hypothetical protein
MIRVIQHNCARSYEWTIAALEMGVEPRADVVCLQDPRREKGGIGDSHSANQIRNRKCGWTATGRLSGLMVNEWTDLSTGANDNVIAMDVRRRRGTITTNHQL